MGEPVHVEDKPRDTHKPKSATSKFHIKKIVAPEIPFVEA